MKTITQYRKDIEIIEKELAEMRDKCVQENRDPLAEEIARSEELMDEIERIELVVSNEERMQTTRNRVAKPVTEAIKPDPESNPTKTEQEKRDRFSNFGEQMQAVMRAGLPGGNVDPRLYTSRATGLSAGVPSDGGFLVQTDFSNEILQQIWSNSLIASLCRRVTISGNANSIKINGVDETSRVASSRMGGVLGYWIAEAGTKQASAPKFRQITLDLNKLVALMYTTDDLLDDSAALAGFIQDAARSELDFMIQDSVINGSGAGMPLGILNAGCLISAAKETGQAAATIVAENIINMWRRLFASSRPNSVWLVNQNVEPQLHTMSIAVGTGGVPVYMPAGGLSASPYGTLFGRPVHAIEQCQTLGTVGDIYLADFTNGYILAEKGGMKSAMSIHVQFLADESVFRFVIRLDGQPIRQTAMTPFKGGATDTQGHFIALATRA